MRSRPGFALASLALATLVLLHGCSLVGDREDQVSAEDWRRRTALLINRGLTVTPEHAQLMLPPSHSNDIYGSALAVQALARTGNLADSDWQAFEERVRDEVDGAGMSHSVAGPQSTALELLTAARLADRQLVSNHFETALGESATETNKGADIYDMFASLAVRKAMRRDLPTLKEVAQAELANQLRTDGCASVESLYLLGAASSIGLAQSQCTSVQVRRLVADQAQKALAEIRTRPEQAGLPHAEVLLAAGRLRQRGVAFPRAAVDLLQRKLELTISAKWIEGTSVVAGVLAQAAADRGVNLNLGRDVVAALRLVVRSGGEPQSIRLTPSTRVLVARTLRLIGDAAPLDLLTVTPQTQPSVALDAALARRIGGREVEPYIRQLLERRGNDRQRADVTLLLRAVNRLGVKTCAWPELKPQVRKIVADTTEDLLDLSLALRWMRVCGEEQPDHERLAQDHAIDQAKHQGSPTNQDLLSAWQLAAVRCALAPHLLDPDKAWDALHSRADSHGGVRSQDGEATDLTETFALAALIAPRSTSCHHGTFG